MITTAELSRQQVALLKMSLEGGGVYGVIYTIEKSELDKEMLDLVVKGVVALSPVPTVTHDAEGQVMSNLKCYEVVKECIPLARQCEVLWALTSMDE